MELSQEISKIQVPDTSVLPLEGSSNKKQAFYRVESVTKNDEIISVFRNYPDFLKIRRLLIYRWPGIYIPYVSLKPKLVFLNIFLL